jgi:hypothetical protein
MFTLSPWSGWRIAIAVRFTFLVTQESKPSLMPVWPCRFHCGALPCHDHAARPNRRANALRHPCAQRSCAISGDITLWPPWVAGQSLGCGRRHKDNVVATHGGQGPLNSKVNVCLSTSYETLLAATEKAQAESRVSCRRASSLIRRAFFWEGLRVLIWANASGTCPLSAAARFSTWLAEPALSKMALSGFFDPART